jgi:hypothetical protein
MKKLIAVILFVMIFVTSCGQSSKETDLESMLSSVPSDPASSCILWFGDMERIKDLSGLDPDIDVIEFTKFIKTINTNLEFKRLMEILSGYAPSDFSGGVYSETWRDFFGFDAFDNRQELWGEILVEQNGTRSLFSLIKGNFDKNNIVEKLNGLGYSLKTYASIDYYSVRADYQIGDIKNSEAARMALFHLNRMMVKEQEIIAAPADDIFFSIIDAYSGKRSALNNSTSYTRVAESLGDVLGAVLIPQSLLRSKNVKADWNMLHTYDLVGIGYGIEGQDIKLIITLHYPDKSASNDINEISRRMAEYAVISVGLSTPMLCDLFEIGKPEATTYGPDSILKVELIYKSDTPSWLWSTLVKSQDVGFLVTSPSESQ